MFSFSESRNRYTVLVQSPISVGYLMSDCEEVMDFLLSRDGLAMPTIRAGLIPLLDNPVYWTKDIDGRCLAFNYNAEPYNFTIIRLSVSPTLT